MCLPSASGRERDARDYVPVALTPAAQYGRAVHSATCPAPHRRRLRSLTAALRAWAPKLLAFSSDDGCVCLSTPD
jgi:hypothetical protein